MSSFSPEGYVISDVVAKILVLVDGVLDIFVDTTYTASGGGVYACCSIGTYTANVTDCGTQLICMLGQLTMSIAGLGAYFFGALGVEAG